MQDEFNDPLWRQILSGAQMLFVAFGALVLMGVFLWWQPDYRVRVLVFTSTLALICVAHVRLLLRHGHGFSSRLAAGG